MSKIIEGKLDPKTGKYSFTEVEDGESLLGGFDPDSCKHPNIQFEDDQYDNNGRRTVKHNWWCPDCDFLQVG